MYKRIFLLVCKMFKALIMPPEPECPLCGAEMKHILSSGSRIASVVFRIVPGPLGYSRRLGYYCPKCSYREQGL
jgi:hypothetical protein